MSKPGPITINRPMMAGRELELIEESVAAMHTAGGGPFSARCSELLEGELAAARVLLTPSCTHALEMCAILLDLGPEDEVIVPSFAFVSTVNAFVLRGARPVFADVRPDTLNLDESRLERLINDRTRAIVALHYAGIACEMEAIREIADRHGVPIVEDNAHGLFGAYRGRQLGTLSPLATLSFHETKNFICGEGGALIVNDPALVDRAEIVRDKGTDRQRMFRGQVDKYTWIDLGSSYVMADLLAAFLLAQLEQRDSIQSMRRTIWETYDEGLRGWADGHGIRLPRVPDGCTPAYHLYWLLVPSLDVRQDLIRHLDERGVGVAFHYQPLNISAMGLRFGGAVGDCPVTEDAADRLIRLPFHHALTPDDLQRVIAEIRGYFDGS